MRVAVWHLVITAAGLAIGCGSAQGLVPVEGTITLDGKPLADAKVALSPTRANGPGPYVAKTDEQGKFVIGPVEKTGAGATAGEYFVIITTVDPPPQADESTPPPPTEKEIVPSEYRSGTRRFEVPPGGTRQADFAMSSDG